MKKIFVILVALIGFGISVNAQCITGTPAKGVVNFTFSNSSDKKVNVTYSLSIAGVIVVANENVLVSADGKDMQISYSINKYSQNLKREDVKIDITGADCKKE